MIKNLFCSLWLVLLFVSSPFAAGTVDFHFQDAPVKDIAVMVSDLTGAAISGSFGDKRMTLMCDGMETNEILPVFTNALSTIGMTLVKTDWGYIVRPVEQGFDPSSGWYVHPLHYAKAADVQAALVPVIGSSGSVSAVGEHQILISGPPSLVTKYAGMIRAMDVMRSADVDRFPLMYLRVSEAISRLNADNSQVKLIPDYWGKAIIVQGSIQDRLLIQATIEAMDQPSPGIDSRVIPIHTQEADQVLTVVQSMFDGLNCYVSGKSLLVSGPADLCAAAEKLVADMDGSSLQVRVECVIASLTDQEFEELGVRLSTSGTLSANLNAAGYASLLSPGPGLLLDLVSGSLSASALASSSTSHGEVLSSPVLTALSGHPAKIVVGQNVPFIDAQTKTQAGDTEYSVSRQDVGVTLSITPHVEGDFIYLTVSQEVSNIDPSTSTAVDLITEKREVESTVKLADGESIFLGGVKSMEKGKTRERVPILGWIPLLGEVFTYRKTTENSRNLVISLRPTIVRQHI